MKNLFSIFFALAMLFVISAGAQTITTTTNVLFNPALPAGTNSSAVYPATGNLRISRPFFQFQNGGLNATNALYWNIQVAIGNTNNFATVAVWNHAGTNYTADIDSTNLNNLAVYVRVQAVNTNAATTIPGVVANISQ